MSYNSGKPGDESHYYGQGKSSVIVFCVLFIFITIYTIIRCHFPRDPPPDSSSRNQASRADSNETNNPQNDHNDHHSIQIHGRGLDLRVISSLPTSQFKKNEGSNKECAICLGEFEDQEWVKRLPRCVHVFHVSCITTWFQNHKNCPICRANVIVNEDRQLALAMESSVSNYTPTAEVLNREDFVPERPSHVGHHTPKIQPISCST